MRRTIQPATLLGPTRLIAAAAAAALLLGGCVAPQHRKPLYYWGAFERQQYEALLHEGASPEDQIHKLDEAAEKARASNSALPPGFRAHLGMLHLATGNVDQARTLWEAERVTFPESAPYMNQLLKRLDTPMTADAKKPT